jgi:hypothetical protein
LMPDNAAVTERQTIIVRIQGCFLIRQRLLVGGSWHWQLERHQMRLSDVRIA